MITDKEHKRIIRVDRKSAGLCTDCGKIPPVDGGARCARCRRKKKDRLVTHIASMSPEQYVTFRMAAREAEGYQEFLDLIVAAGDRIGWPFFFRI